MFCVAAQHSIDTDCRTQDFYAITLDALKEANNERLWFKTNLKLCGLWFRMKEYARAIRILKELHRCAFITQAKRKRACICS